MNKHITFYMIVFVIFVWVSTNNGQSKYILSGNIADNDYDLFLEDALVTVIIGDDSLNMSTDSAGNYNGELELAATSVKEENLPPEFEIISQNYPNPFNPSTNIKFYNEGIFELFDINGQRVISEKIKIQRKDISLNLSAGVYFYSFINDERKRSVRKMVLLDGSYTTISLIPEKQNLKSNKSITNSAKEAEAVYKIRKDKYVTVETNRTLIEEHENIYDFKLEFDFEHCGNEAGNGDEIVDGPPGPDYGAEDYDQIFRSLSVHPLNPDIVIVGTERNGFVKSTDGGITWTRYRAGLRHTDIGYTEVYDIAIDPNNPSVIYAATVDSPGPVVGNYPSSIGGLYKSADGGETWFRYNCGLDNSRVTSVRVDPGNSDNIIIGLEGGEPSFTGLEGVYFGGGIYRSTNGGMRWLKVDVLNNDDTLNGFWQISTFGSGSNFITFGVCSFQNSGSGLSSNVGFLKTTDAGKTWTPFGEQLREKIITHFGLSQDGQIIYASERDKYFLYKSIDGGDTWSETGIVQAGGPVAVSPANKDLVVYAGFNRLYRTDNGFQTYELVLENDSRIDDIVFSESDPEIVYVGTTGYNIYKSSDSGKTFSLLVNLRQDVLNN